MFGLFQHKSRLGEGILLILSIVVLVLHGRDAGLNLGQALVAALLFFAIVVGLGFLLFKVFAVMFALYDRWHERGRKD